jgi:hypothetical protein
VSDKAERVNGFYWVSLSDTTGTYRSICEYFDNKWFSCGRVLKPRRVSDVNEQAIIENNCK